MTTKRPAPFDEVLSEYQWDEMLKECRRTFVRNNRNWFLTYMRVVSHNKTIKSFPKTQDDFDCLWRMYEIAYVRGYCYAHERMQDFTPRVLR